MTKCPCCGIDDNEETVPSDHDRSCIWYQSEETMSYKQKQSFILIGASGSGKSTARRQLEEKFSDCVVNTFSLDDCRINFYKEKKEKSTEVLSEGELYSKAFAYANKRGKEFDEYVAARWKDALNAQVVIVDNVNGTRKSRSKWIEPLKKANFLVTAVQLQTPLNVIIARQATRGDKSVPENIVRQQYMHQEEAMVGSEFDELIVVDGTKPWRI